ncbi:MAG TPA: TadE family protein [Methylotenera sp.]|nr:TadE family protein [Methylotenera sp.]
MRGVAAVEFTILMAFLYAPLVLGTVEIGRVLFQYNTLVKSVRDSARYISLYSATGPNYAMQVTIAKCMAAFGNTGCTGNPIVSGLTTGNILIGNDGSGTPIDAGSAGTVALKLITVRVSGYQLSYITNIFISGGFKAFNDISATMRQATT